MDDVTGKIRVIIVDDVQTNLTILSAMLRKLQIQDVFCCKSAFDVLRNMKRFRPTLVITDIWMPGMMGDELASKIKQDPESSHIPIIAISADAHTPKSEYFNELLLKPLTVESLGETIYRLINLDDLTVEE